MKNVSEGFAVFLVGLLSLGIVYFIIQYSMIDDENIVTVVDESVYVTPADTGAQGDDIDDDIDLAD
ncbi:hypothetical protein [Sulfurovum sp.]|uniref:hypothetical protein n=1 Tax=Sulfurovum sp. TaxID=1969726 RepID=UPI002867F4FF|nr:hypothetical protein [Sulfurovum sp.]